MHMKCQIMNIINSNDQITISRYLNQFTIKLKEIIWKKEKETIVE